MDKDFIVSQVIEKMTRDEYFKTVELQKLIIRTIIQIYPDESDYELLCDTSGEGVVDELEDMIYQELLLRNK